MLLGPGVRYGGLCFVLVCDQSLLETESSSLSVVQACELTMELKRNQKSSPVPVHEGCFLRPCWERKPSFIFPSLNLLSKQTSSFEAHVTHHYHPEGSLSLSPLGNHTDTQLLNSVHMRSGSTIQLPVYPLFHLRSALRGP